MYSTFGEVWRPTEELIVAKPGNFGIVWMCSGPSLMLRKSLNLVWNFFLQYFWKYCQKKKVAHPSFLLGCSKPSERFFALNSNIFHLFVCWDIYLVQFYCSCLYSQYCLLLKCNNNICKTKFSKIFVNKFIKLIDRFFNVVCEERIYMYKAAWI